MASIKKRTTSDGTPRYDVRYRDPSGKVHTKTFKRRKDADLHAASVETDMSRGAWVDPNAGRVKLKDYAATWVTQRTTRRGRKLAPRTIELYRYLLNTHINPTLGSTELRDLTVRQIRAWHSERIGTGHAIATAKAYRLLRTILTTAVEDELILKNPCAIKGAAQENSPERTVATAEQVWDLADAIEERLRAFVLLGAFVGLRFAEVAGLQRRHVDLLHRTVQVKQQLQTVSKATAKELDIPTVGFGPPKTEAGYRTLTIPAAIVPYLEHHLATYSEPTPDGLVFIGSRGAPIHHSRFCEKFAKARAKTDLPKSFRFHDLRHTHMTTAAESGASTKELMRRLGQSSSAAAIRYQHASDRRDAEIADSVGEKLARPAGKPRDARAKRQIGGQRPA